MIWQIVGGAGLLFSLVGLLLAVRGGIGGGGSDGSAGHS